MSEVLQISLRSGKDDAVRRFHPWVFSGAIKKMSGPARDGCHAEILSNKGEYLASGIYQDATIAVRLLAFAPERPASFTQAFWSEKLKAAFTLRERAVLTNEKSTNMYRLVHGEGDHLPGLIIDHYNGHLVVQIHATGLYQFLDDIAAGLREVYGNRLQSIYDKSKDTLPAHFWQDKDSRGFLYKKEASGGEQGLVKVLENGLDFLVDIRGGQKTGFFIDQRENRLLLSRYCHDKKVLNAFAYSGGFSAYALRAGASEVHSLDSSARAIDLCRQNIAGKPWENKHKAITSDVMNYLRSSQEEYEVIVLDPPAYAKHQRVKHQAIQGYKRLNLEAIKSIAKDGILFTFSCSQVIDMQLFTSTVTSAAILAQRKVRILHKLSQAPDHPVNIFHPEGHYLKGLVLAID